MQNGGNISTRGSLLPKVRYKNVFFSGESRYNPKFNIVTHFQSNNLFCCNNSRGNSKSEVPMTRKEAGMGGSNQDRILYMKHRCLEESNTCKVKLEYKQSRRNKGNVQQVKTL